MTIIVCSATKCNFNKGNRCTRDVITVQYTVWSGDSPCCMEVDEDEKEALTDAY